MVEKYKDPYYPESIEIDRMISDLLRLTDKMNT